MADPFDFAAKKRNDRPNLSGERGRCHHRGRSWGAAESPRFADDIFLMSRTIQAAPRTSSVSSKSTDLGGSALALWPLSETFTHQIQGEFQTSERGRRRLAPQAKSLSIAGDMDETKNGKKKERQLLATSRTGKL